MADNNIKENLDDAGENLAEAAKSTGRAARSTGKAAKEATEVAAENVADVAEDVAEESGKVFTKPTILNDLSLVTSTTVRLVTVGGFTAFGALAGLVVGTRVVQLADRVITKRKA